MKIKILQSDLRSHLSLGIVITGGIFQSDRVIDGAWTIMIDIGADVLFPYVNRELARTTPRRGEIFINESAKRNIRCNRFQHIRADKRYSRSGAKAQWAPDEFKIKTICKWGVRINRRVQSTRRQREQLLGTNRWINSVRLATQGVFSV